MKKFIVSASLVFAAASIAKAALFYTPVSISSTNSTAFYAIENLIQGPGVGYSAALPHDGIPGQTWVTTDPGGYPSDYIATAGAPVLVIDLGSDLYLTEISTWGYTTSNDNGVSAFSLRFATSSEGTGNFGASIPGQGGFTAAKSDITRDSHLLLPVTARFVEFTATDNFFLAPGFSGGDRIGLGEIAFEAVPEPSTALLGSAALLGLLRRRRSMNR